MANSKKNVNNDIKVYHAYLKCKKLNCKINIWIFCDKCLEIIIKKYYSSYSEKKRLY